MDRPEVTWAQVARWRSERHLLGAERARSAVDVARRLGGVHAQLASSASAAVRLRAPTVTAARLTAALDTRRTLVKLWAARGTLHLLPSADLPTWVAVMSTRTREVSGPWLRANGVTATEMTTLLRVLPEVVGAEPLTREELADRVVGATGDAHLRAALTQGWGSLLKPAAFKGLLCFGPNRGRNVTFVAPRAWLRSRWREVDTDEAVDALARAHLDAYGPSSPAELSRWLDLALARAKASYRRLADELVTVDVEGEALAVGRAHLEALARPPGEPLVHLLPGFDPYVVGSTRQLEHLAPAAHKKEISRTSGWISATLCVDGMLLGTWRGEPARGALRIDLVPFGPLPRRVRAALPEVAARAAALAGHDRVELTVGG